MEDIRYSEFLFLSALASGKITLFNDCDSGAQAKAVGVAPGIYYSEMAAALIEDLYVRFRSDNIQLLVAKLRGELFNIAPPLDFYAHYWNNPRPAIREVLSRNSLQEICITYRGLRRIEELRDLLKRDRILEDFGVLLSIRYFSRDFQDALQRASEVSVSVLFADMDDFGKINKQFGYAAGNVVMQAYLEILRDCLGSLGTAYRGSGDEICALILGQGHGRVVEIAETIRKKVEVLHCNYNGAQLPKVTSSIGVATTPPLPRTMDVETSAQDRQRQAKQQGKNRVVAS